MNVRKVWWWSACKRIFSTRQIIQSRQKTLVKSWKKKLDLFHIHLKFKFHKCWNVWCGCTIKNQFVGAQYANEQHANAQQSNHFFAQEQQISIRRQKRLKQFSFLQKMNFLKIWIFFFFLLQIHLLYILLPTNKIQMNENNWFVQTMQSMCWKSQSNKLWTIWQCEQTKWNQQ